MYKMLIKHLIIFMAYNIIFIHSLVCKTKIINMLEIKLEQCSSFENISEEIDTLINSSLKITALTIIESGLTEIPQSVCNLDELVDLNLSLNRIKTIPYKCFNNKQKIQTLNLSNNELREIIDGTFDGMHNLNNLIIEKNKLEYIGTRVFTNVTDLPNLKYITFDENKLKSLDVWPIVRSLYISDSTIRLSNNMIENFTNIFNWKYSCKFLNDINHIKFELFLDHNKIKHMMSFVRAYFGDIKTLLCFFSAEANETSSDVQLHFNGNPYKCDCIDFPVLRLIRVGQRTSVIDRLYCHEPEQLHGRKLTSLALEELVCEVSEEHLCPVGCQCRKQPSNATFHILCQSMNFTKFPQAIPSTKIPTTAFAKYKLIFANNSITDLSPRSYFKNTIWLDVSNAKIRDINNETWNAIKDIKEIYLYNNQINILPKIILEEPGNFELLSIYNNPISCACENVWFKDWIISKQENMERLESIICKTPSWLEGKSIIHIKDEEFCNNPYYENTKKTALIIVLIFLGVLAIIVMVLLLIYYYRIQVNAILRIHPFDRDECTGEDMRYDAFISCSYQDRDIAIQLISLLESRGFVVCYHEKDFVGGEKITDNINNAIKQSRRMLCIISQEFLNSPMCMYEFDVAHLRNINMKRSRLILVLLQPEKQIPVDIMSPSFQEFISSHTYIEYGSYKKLAENKSLIYAMPVKPLKPNDMMLLTI